MSMHEQKDLVFEVPDGWDDRSIIAYTAPPAAGGSAAPSVVVTRDKLEKGETIKQYGNRQLGHIAKAFESFSLLDLRETEIGGKPASELTFTWMGQSGPVWQRLTMAAKSDGSVLSFAATAPRAQAEAFEKTLAGIYATVTFTDTPPPAETKPEVAAAPAPPKSDHDIPASPPTEPPPPSRASASPFVVAKPAPVPFAVPAAPTVFRAADTAAAPPAARPAPPSPPVPKAPSRPPPLPSASPPRPPLPSPPSSQAVPGVPSESTLVLPLKPPAPPPSKGPMSPEARRRLSGTLEMRGTAPPSPPSSGGLPVSPPVSDRSGSSSAWPVQSAAEVRRTLIGAMETEEPKEAPNRELLVGLGERFATSGRSEPEPAVLSWVTASPSARRLELACAVLHGLWQNGQRPVYSDYIDALRNARRGISWDTPSLRSFVSVLCDALPHFRVPDSSTYTWIVRELTNYHDLMVKKEKPDPFIVAIIRDTLGIREG